MRQKLEISRAIHDQNMFIVSGPLARDPVVVIYINNMLTTIFDDHFALCKNLKFLSRTFEKVNALTFLTMVGEDAEKFYNRNLE